MSLRDRTVIPGSFILTGGLGLMWVANLTSLKRNGGFAGIVGWLIPGIAVVAMRNWLLLQRIVKEWRESSWRKRRRLLCQLVPSMGNLFANGVAIDLIVFCLQVGSLRIIKWDRVCLWVAGGTIVGMIVLTVILKLVFKVALSAKLFVAGVALGTRAFQQGMLVLSPQLKLIPWGTPVGLSLIALLLWFLSYVEFKAAKQENSAGLWEARLMVWADASNLFAAGILMVGWSYLQLSI